jgi:hypothetical protein
MSVTSTTDVDTRLLAGFALQAVPDEPGMPTTSDIDIAGSGLARLRAARPDLHEALLGALDRAAELGTADLIALKDVDRAAYDAIVAAVAGLYLTDDAVKAAYGYPGRIPLDVGDPFSRSERYEGMVAPVRDRGFVWRSTPPSG